MAGILSWFGMMLVGAECLVAAITIMTLIQFGTLDIYVLNSSCLSEAVLDQFLGAYVSAQYV
jgi:hypothetical protein